MVVSEKHELATEDSISVNQLQSLPMIMYPKQFLGRRLLDAHSQQHGIHLNTVVETTTGPSLFRFVKANIGATLQPLPLSRSLDEPDLRIIPINDYPPTREIGIVYRADKYLSYAVQRFIETMVEKLKL